MKYKDIPCENYLAEGICKKGVKRCSHKGICQHCSQYRARSKKHPGKEKEKYNRKDFKKNEE